MTYEQRQRRTCVPQEHLEECCEKPSDWRPGCHGVYAAAGRTSIWEAKANPTPPERGVELLRDRTTNAVRDTHSQVGADAREITAGV